jgi:hypothetical protein
MTEYEALGRCYKLRDLSKYYKKDVKVPCTVLNKIYVICGHGERYTSSSVKSQEVLVYADVLDILISRAQKNLQPAIQLLLPGIQ